MDSFEINKILGAGLLAATVILGTSILTEGLFHVKAPEKAGWDIEVPEEGDHAAGGTQEAGEVEPSIAVLLASANAESGAKVAKKCASCHDFSAGGANKTGPLIYNIVNRKIGSADGFKYSQALLDYGADKTWTFDELNGFLLKPKEHIPGTTMGFAGLKKPEDRADIIAYLTSLSDNPVPFPTPEAAEPAASSDAVGAPAEQSASEGAAHAEQPGETEGTPQDAAHEATEAVKDAVEEAGEATKDAASEVIEVKDDTVNSASEAVAKDKLPQ